MAGYRTERDSMGEVRVPEHMLYGAQTQRAAENFPVSGIRFPPLFVRTLGLIKGAAAAVNEELGLLSRQRAGAIRMAAEEVSSGKWDEHFPLDIFQTGSGTSTHMNANEVIATRAMQILKCGGISAEIHPNDHVNLGQSSNDVIPTAIHVSSYTAVQTLLLPRLEQLEEALKRRAVELGGVIKTGRTHLMDAVPLTLGQEIGGWAYQLSQSRERIKSCLPNLAKLAIGGTAVGTGINTHPDFGKGVVKMIARATGHPFVETDNHFAAQSSMDAAAELSGQLKTAASGLMKIANDIRLMSSGPHAGFAEIVLPALQPGSSIMPGKVNPAGCESLIMVCVKVIANDVAVTISNSRGDFQLNVMLPLIACCLLDSVELLANSAGLFAQKVVEGFTVNEKKIEADLRHNPALGTLLAKVIGYDKAAAIVMRAHAEGKSIRDVAAAMTSLTEEELTKLLDRRSWL